MKTIGFKLLSDSALRTVKSVRELSQILEQKFPKSTIYCRSTDHYIEVALQENREMVSQLLQSRGLLYLVGVIVLGDASTAHTFISIKKA